MATHTLTLNFSSGGTPLSHSVDVSVDDAIDIETDVTLPQNTTDQLANLVFSYANLKSCYIYSDAAVTIETNATDATGGNTLTIAAGKPFVWYSGCGLTNPFTFNVTKLYLTCTAAATVNIRIKHTGSS